MSHVNLHSFLDVQNRRLHYKSPYWISNLEYSSLPLVQPLLANLLKTFVKLPSCNVCEIVYVKCMSTGAE